MLTSALWTGEETISRDIWRRISDPRSAAILLLVFPLGADDKLYTVPGLSDNKELGIRKNKMTLAGTEVRKL